MYQTFLSRLRRRAQRDLARGRAALLLTATGSARTVLPGGVALTFDDGPMPGSTDRVLDVLAELAVTATFFCVGRNAERHPGLLRRIAQEGHAVGSHSLTHPHPRTLTPAQVTAEYADGHAAVEQALGAPVALFRPPHGHLSWRTLPVLRPHRPVLWSVDPQDWRPGVARAHVEQVCGAAGAGDVVLLHDWIEQPEDPQALDRSATIDALPAVAASIRSRGLHFVRVTP